MASAAWHFARSEESRGLLSEVRFVRGSVVVERAETSLGFDGFWDVLFFFRSFGRLVDVKTSVLCFCHLYTFHLYLGRMM